MCDTLVALGRDRTLFAKNSDRPPSEVQLVEALPRRPSGGRVRTQYLEIDDAGAHALLGSRPDWLWGFEHGVNEHGLAVGNEQIWTTDDPGQAADALIGMDLVRLMVERAETAGEAVDVLAHLLAEHGQGGVATATRREAYWSSFLVADPAGAWIVETSGRSWVAEEVEDGASISNRVTLSTEWDRASGDVGAGEDWGARRDPRHDPAHADERLAVTGAAVASGAAALSPRDLAATMRDHGNRPWGRPGAGADDWAAPPPARPGHGTGVTVCQHVRGYSNTTASMICELRPAGESVNRAWFAPGNPCVSVYLPAFVPSSAPPVLADAGVWKTLAVLRDRIEADGDELGPIRDALAPLEDELWEAADALVEHPDRWQGFTDEASRRFEEAVTALA